MPFEPLMLFGGKAVGHAGDVVSHDPLRFCRGNLRTFIAAEPVNMRLRHLRRVGQIGFEQIAHHLLRSLGCTHHLWMTV